MLVDLYMKTYDEGGRSSAIAVGSYRPVFRIAYNASETTLSRMLYIPAGTVTNAYDYNNNNASIKSIEPGSHQLAKVYFGDTTAYPMFIGETIYVFDGSRTVGIGQVVARTDEQISEIVNNCVRITFNDSIRK